VHAHGGNQTKDGPPGTLYICTLHSILPSTTQIQNEVGTNVTSAISISPFVCLVCMLTHFPLVALHACASPQEIHSVDMDRLDPTPFNIFDVFDVFDAFDIPQEIHSVDMDRLDPTAFNMFSYKSSAALQADKVKGYLGIAMSFDAFLQTRRFQCTSKATR
jgi:hypothetical protein